MNKEQLVKAVAHKAKLSQKEVGELLDATVQVISKALNKGEKVTLVGFGTFQVRQRAAREGRNPRTGKPLAISAKSVPAFSAGKGLKEAVAQQKSGK